MGKKTIHIATLWDSNNYGAYLQAYSLATFLTRNNFEVSFLKECRCNETKSFNTIISLLKCFFKFWNREFLYYKRLEKAYAKPLKRFKLDTLDGKVYATVIGSDEVWNVSNPHFKHLPLYVGDGVNSDCVLSYAPSCNNTDKDQFEKVYGKSPFSQMDYISVRDDSTLNLVKSFGVDNLVKVLDPTFLLDNYNDILKQSSLENYILIYGYSFSDTEIRIIKKFANQRNLKLVSVGVYLAWTDLQIPASPDEFLGLVKNANYVVTSTFHGTVFSIIFNKQFIVFAREKKKVLELLHDFMLSKRNASIYDFTIVSEEVINYEAINRIIAERKEESISFLLNSLKMN